MNDLDLCLEVVLRLFYWLAARASVISMTDVTIKKINEWMDERTNERSETTHTGD